MRKPLIFIIIIFVGLLASSAQGGNQLRDSQYDAIKTFNDAFFEEYLKMYDIQPIALSKIIPPMLSEIIPAIFQKDLLIN